MNTKKIFKSKYFSIMIFWFGVMFGLLYEHPNRTLIIIILCFHFEIRFKNKFVW